MDRRGTLDIYTVYYTCASIVNERNPRNRKLREAR